MLRWRLILGAVFVSALFGLCWADDYVGSIKLSPPGTVLFPIGLCLAAAGAGEVLWLFRKASLDVNSSLVYGGSVAVVLANWIPQALVIAGMPNPLGVWGWPAAALAAAVMGGFVQEILRYQRPGGAMQRLGLGILGVAYIGWLFSFIAQLRWVGPAGTTTGRWGMIALASLLVVVKFCDIGAYTFGRLFGGKLFKNRKLAPRLSPGKTIEGAIGGLVLATFGAWFVLEWLSLRVIGASSGLRGGWVLFGICVGAAGIIGDLAESLIKRDVGSKDSSPWMPGFGGLLDLIDSLLLAAPVAYLFWALRLVGP